MSSERDFDRLARAWLDIGPDEAPDRVVASILHAVTATPQVRRPRFWSAWIPFPVNRLSRVGGVAAVAVGLIAGGILISQLSRMDVGGPVISPSASPSPSPEASATPGASPSASPAPAASIVLQRAPANLGCDSIDPGYRSVTIRIDPESAVELPVFVWTGDSAAPQRQAVDVWAEPGYVPGFFEPGTTPAPRIAVYWAAGFSATDGEMPVIRGPRGEEVARDGTRIDLAEGVYPPLADYFLCASGNGLYVLDQPKPSG